MKYLLVHKTQSDIKKKNANVGNDQEMEQSERNSHLYPPKRATDEGSLPEIAQYSP